MDLFVVVNSEFDFPEPCVLSFHSRSLTMARTHVSVHLYPLASLARPLSRPLSCCAVHELARPDSDHLRRHTLVVPRAHRSRLCRLRRTARGQLRP